MDLDLIDKCSKKKTGRFCEINGLCMSEHACHKKVGALSSEIERIEKDASKSDILKSNIWRGREETRLQKVKDKKWQKIGNKSHKDFKEYQVDGDGNCFYRCLAAFLLGTQDAHDRIRSEMCEYMDRHSKYFECYVDGPIDSHIANHRHTDGRTVSWATEAEFYAASSLYSVNINVDTDGTLDWHTHALRLDGNSGETNCIPYSLSVYLKLQRNHFNLLMMKDKECVQNRTHSTFDWFDMTDSASNEIKDSVADVSTKPKEPDETLCGEVIVSDPKRKKKVRSKTDKSKVGEETPKTCRSSRDCISDTVTNLSSYSLSDDETSLLSKGLKFIPDRSRIDKLKVLTDLGEWERRMRLREFFL